MRADDNLGDGGCAASEHAEGAIVTRGGALGGALLSRLGQEGQRWLGRVGDSNWHCVDLDDRRLGHELRWQAGTERVGGEDDGWMYDAEDTNHLGVATRRGQVREALASQQRTIRGQHAKGGLLDKDGDGT